MVRLTRILLWKSFKTEHRFQPIPFEESAVADKTSRTSSRESPWSRPRKWESSEWSFGPAGVCAAGKSFRRVCGCAGAGSCSLTTYLQLCVAPARNFHDCSWRGHSRARHACPSRVRRLHRLGLRVLCRPRSAGPDKHPATRGGHVAAVQRLAVSGLPEEQRQRLWRRGCFAGKMRHWHQRVWESLAANPPDAVPVRVSACRVSFRTDTLT